jgi:aminomethyltransferase
MANTPDPASLQRTPLNRVHREAGARLVPFAGWEMPVQYAGLVAEHQAVRQAVGLFDVSHMGEFRISGRGAPQALNRLVTGDVESMTLGQALYTLVCREDGGIIDDIIVYRMAKDSYFLCVNAANISKDARWFSDHLANMQAVTFEDISAHYGQIAVQGPRSFDLMSRAIDTPIKTLPYYHAIEAKVFGTPCIVARTGYTGELGYEIYLDGDQAPRVWLGLMESGRDLGVQPCGLGARDTLRVEVGFNLYGQDMDETTHALESSLAWTVNFSKSDFIGKSALEAIKKQDTFDKLVGYQLDAGPVPRAGHVIYAQEHGGDPIGCVTSGVPSPTVGKRVGFCRVRRSHSPVASMIWIDVRGKRVLAQTCSRTFYSQGSAKRDLNAVSQ